MYDWLNGKLVEVLIIVSQKFSPMQATIIAMSSWNEHVITTIEKLESIRGAELTIISCTLFFPT
jgi:hypothetical protein